MKSKSAKTKKAQAKKHGRRFNIHIWSVGILSFTALVSASLLTKQSVQYASANHPGFNLSYELRGSGCSTGFHDFRAITQYCHGLNDDAFNNSCAKSIRQKIFESDCTGRQGSLTDPHGYSMRRLPPAISPSQS